MKNANNFNYVALTSFLQDADQGLRAIAEFLIMIGLSKFEEKFNTSDYEELQPASVGRIREVYGKIKNWNPLYRQFDVGETRFERLAIQFAMDYHNDYDSIYAIFNTHQAPLLPNQSEIEDTLKSLGVETKDDLEDFLNWLDINGYSFDPFKSLTYNA